MIVENLRRASVTKWEFLVLREDFVQDMIGLFDFCGGNFLKT